MPPIPQLPAQPSHTPAPPPTIGVGGNPLRVPLDSKVSVAAANDYGTEFLEYAAQRMMQNLPGVVVTIKPTKDLTGEVQPKLADAAPDAISNAGPSRMRISSIADKLAPLDPLLRTKNYAGQVISDVLYPSASPSGSFGGRLVQFNYAMSVYGLWYSGKMFAAHGWRPPKTWDEAYKLGEKAKKLDKYLFWFTGESAINYQTLVISSAIKQGGDEVRRALDNLEPNCWRQPTVQEALIGLRRIISAGFVKPGGQHTTRHTGLTEWVLGADSLCHPAGPWIEREVREQMPPDFQLMVTPDPTVNAKAAMPATALHATPEEGLLVPNNANNLVGGMEFLRALYSPDAAAEFARINMTPTVVKGTVPEDGYGSTALKSQVRALEAAGSHHYSWHFVDFYDMTAAQEFVWKRFLSGEMTVAEITDALQRKTDEIREDDSIEKVRFT